MDLPWGKQAQDTHSPHERSLTKAGENKDATERQTWHAEAAWSPGHAHTYCHERGHAGHMPVARHGG